MRARLLHTLLLVTGWLASAQTAFAQTGIASLSGRVVDLGGNFVPGAVVRAYDNLAAFAAARNSYHTTATTDTGGNFVLPSLETNRQWTLVVSYDANANGQEDDYRWFAPSFQTIAHVAGPSVAADFRLQALTDNLAPGLSIANPIPNISQSLLGQAEGTVAEAGSGILGVWGIVQTANGSGITQTYNPFTGNFEVVATLTGEHYLPAVVVAGSWSLLLPGLPADTYRLQVVALDHARNASALAAVDFTQRNTYYFRAENSDWLNLANWQPTGIPGPEDAIVVDHGTLDTGSQTVGELNFLGGRIHGPLSMVPGGSLHWSAGTFSNGSVVLPANTVSLIGGPAGKFMEAAVLANAGAVIFSAGTVGLNYGSGLTNAGIFTLTGNVNFTDGGLGAGSWLHNSGTLASSARTLVNQLGVVFTNAGALELNSGPLNLGSGFIAQTSSVLRVSLGGLNAGMDFGRMTIGGTATLAGGLAVTLTNSFAPTTNDVFVLLTHASRNGTFTSPALPTLPAQLKWRVDYQPTSTTLRVEAVLKPAITNFSRLVNGVFQLTATGEPASRCIIQASINLTNWVSLQTNAPFTGTFNFSDASAAAVPYRFYRFQMVE